MNLPNKLTLLRILLVPVFLVCIYVPFPHQFLAALIVFVLASVTDALDGHIARSRNLITTFGKFADPLADKILVLAAFAAFADLSTMRTLVGGSAFSLHVSGIVVTIIAAREFMVSGLRLVPLLQVDAQVFHGQNIHFVAPLGIDQIVHQFDVVEPAFDGQPAAHVTFDVGSRYCDGPIRQQGTQVI